MMSSRKTLISGRPASRTQDHTCVDTASSAAILLGMARATNNKVSKRRFVHRPSLATMANGANNFLVDATFRTVVEHLV
jgi:hypothetical protein